MNYDNLPDYAREQIDNRVDELRAKMHEAGCPLSCRVEHIDPIREAVAAAWWAWKATGQEQRSKERKDFAEFLNTLLFDRGPK